MSINPSAELDVELRKGANAHLILYWMSVFFLHNELLRGEQASSLNNHASGVGE